MTTTMAAPLTIGDDVQRMMLGTALVDAARQLHEHARACQQCTRRQRCSEHVISDRARIMYGRAMAQIKAPASVLKPETAAVIAAAIVGAAATRRASQHPLDRALAAAYEVLTGLLVPGDAR